MILPEEMNSLNYDDPESCIRTIESYIRYMAERINWSDNRPPRNDPPPPAQKG